MVKKAGTYQPTSQGASRDNQDAPRILISGGGTGGHVFPAIAIADALRKLDPNTVLLFVGAMGKLEMEKVPQAGYPIEGLWISGFQRKLTLRNLAFPFKLAHSLVKSGGIIRKFRPEVVVGVGGFASGPTLRSAQQKDIPTLIQEQNSFPGITNRLLAKGADRICVAYEGLDRYFPADRIVHTGNPVRKDLVHLQLDPKTAKTRLGLDPERPLVVIVGGSLGARSLNDAMAASEDLIKKRPEVQIIWQMGRLYEQEFAQSATALLPNVTAKAFLEDMPAIYAGAEVVICRAGASTISELCQVGQAAVLVPSPNVAEDHQTKNAMALVAREAAILVPDPYASAKMLVMAFSLVDDPSRRGELEEKIKKLGIPDAADRIAREILDLRNKKS